MQLIEKILSIFFKKNLERSNNHIKISKENIHSFIETCYRLLLNREPDKEGMDYYSNLINNSSENSLKIFISEIIESEEFNSKFVGLWAIDEINKKKELIKNSYWKWIKSNDEKYLEAAKLSLFEITSKFKRTDVINKIIDSRDEEASYLEIGVRNLQDNFNLIKTNFKYSVDPGFEVSNNEADFKLKSDEFFDLLSKGEIFSKEKKFDVIFIDGLHLAEQVDRDINNALKFIKNDGFIVLHDCNPPTEWHARETYEYHNTPADGAWNGTVWKAFLKRRFDDSLKCCCVNVDWGVGIISKSFELGSSIKNENPFFEYEKFANNRKEYLNLISFEEFKTFF